MPIRPTPSSPTQRAGPGPALQHPAKTTNCNYLRKCLSFEVFVYLSIYFFPKRGGKIQDRCLETTPRKPNADMVKGVGTEYAIQRGVCAFVCVTMCVQEGERGSNRERERGRESKREIPAECPFFILASNKELSILSFRSALDNHFNSNLMKVSTAVGEMGILMYAI